jgi:hypothetical protein
MMFIAQMGCRIRCRPLFVLEPIRWPVRELRIRGDVEVGGDGVGGVSVNLPRRRLLRA